MKKKKNDLVSNGNPLLGFFPQEFAEYLLTLDAKDLTEEEATACEEFFANAGLDFDSYPTLEEATTAYRKKIKN